MAKKVKPPILKFNSEEVHRTDVFELDRLARKAVHAKALRAFIWQEAHLMPEQEAGLMPEPDIYVIVDCRAIETNTDIIFQRDIIHTYQSPRLLMCLTKQEALEYLKTTQDLYERRKAYQKTDLKNLLTELSGATAPTLPSPNEPNL